MAIRLPYWFLFFPLALSGCQTLTAPPLGAPLREEEGMVYLYLQPLPQAAERLRFSLGGLSAERNDGAEFPLPLTLGTFEGSRMGRQRLIASAVLPPGEYTGLKVTVTRAALRTEEGETELLAPEEPVRIDTLFKVAGKKALVLTLELNYAESVRDGSFTPVFAALTPDRPVAGTTGYVVNHGSGTITVFDKKTMQVAAAIAVGGGPRMAAIDQTYRWGYVVSSAEDAVEVIDLWEGQIVDRLRLQIGDGPRELALTRDGAVLVTANTGSGTVMFFDTRSRSELGRLTVGLGPRSVLMDDAGRRAYVFNELSNTISVIDVPNRSIVATVTTDPGPIRGQLSRKGDRLYVIFSGSPNLAVLDTLSLTVVRQEFIGMGAGTIKVDSRTDLIYLGRSREATVDIYEPLLLTPTVRMRAGGPVAAMAIDGDENNLYLVIPERRTVAVVNLVSRKTVGEFDVGESPSWVAMAGER